MKIIILMFMISGPFTSADKIARSEDQRDHSVNLCDPQVPAPIRKVSTPRSVNYFFKVFPDSPYLTFADQQQMYLINMVTGKEYPIEGDYDPVAMGESVLSWAQSHQRGLQFYDVNDILRGTQDPKRLAIKRNFDWPDTEPKSWRQNGSYQSIGKLDGFSRSSRTGQFRMISSEVRPEEKKFRSGQVADYQINMVGNQPQVIMKSPRKPLCPNIDLKLPMISKDGTRIAGVDMTSHSTKIWDLNPDGSCGKVVKDLKLIVGKIDFSFDGKKIAFHVSNSAKTTEWFDGPLKDSHMNIFVSDLENDLPPRQITASLPSENSYFPSWSRNGHVTYCHIDKNGNTKFVEIDPSSVRKLSSKSTYSYDSGSKMLLGQLINSTCESNTTGFEAALLLTRDLTYQACEKLVKEKWSIYKSKIFENLNSILGNRSEVSQLNQLKSELDNTTEKDLLRVCTTFPEDRLLKVGINPIISVYRDADSSLSGARVIAQKCSSCHPGFSLDNISQKYISADLKIKILSRIKSSDERSRMPLGGDPLGEHEIKAIETYINGR